MFTKETGVLTVTTSYTSNPASTTVELKSSYNIPLVLVVAAIPMLIVQPWVAGLMGLFGLFLMFQAVTLRLLFTPTDLDIYRGEKLIRRFPYREWQNWRIFWNRVPILFYFKEVKSIHFLPILFDPNTLKTCLEQRCPRI
ncbi:MAG: DUF3119 family protein [Brasilonema octagenarum HA4186-MV1]|jgi:hypothetical protein|uniref:DUF3119 domain-containing protein n=2 Tax=Brasilonema TaxID=383614 RepID=A0A856MDG4_9CYAN|nr:MULTISPECIES: DUF3119 family protein [Brasilonema]MBW4630089.1 DUF3119 family protein [Brasilonema octagenarum HA4186-MV1]NMF64709.1 DUF3119 domain-containing protein [Brasilonema octagenarum UFV-OR1]QDL07077.1 DUF3119 domain-containing protein [Brasilonema sennae CENA114]QDL13441.1 DUF3119 domain-containing protein [Brasilonema octagenarum UFV-E1]